MCFGRTFFCDMINAILWWTLSKASIFSQSVSASSEWSYLGILKVMLLLNIWGYVHWLDLFPYWYLFRSMCHSINQFNNILVPDNTLHKGNTNPLSRCERCGSQVPAGRLNKCHYTSEKYKQGEERSLRHKTLHRWFEASRFSFQINYDTLPPSEALPHLGRTTSYNNSDWAAVYLNLRKDQRW